MVKKVNMFENMFTCFETIHERKWHWTDGHVTRLAQTCFFHLRRLRSLRRQLGRDVMARLVSALVLSRLDYCNAVLTGLPACTLAPLQRVLHAAARVVMDLRPRNHVSSALRELHWLPIKQRIEFKLCLLVHKSLIGHSSAYISDLLTSAAEVPGRPALRTASRGDFIVPRTNRKVSSDKQTFMDYVMRRRSTVGGALEMFSLPLPLKRE